MTQKFRVGQGFDVHALVPGRKLILGGVEIPHGHGLLGHSDADVLLHAITDAILGAAGLGDIGRLYPDTDRRLSGADSRELLRQVAASAAAAGWSIGNIDATVIAERPRIASYIDAMRAAIANACGISIEAVSIKGKTSERLGYIGRGEGISALAVVGLVSQS